MGPCAVPSLRRLAARCGWPRGAVWCSPAAVFRTTSRAASVSFPVRRAGRSTGPPHHPATPETVSTSPRPSGAQVDETLRNPAAWVPVSNVPHGDAREGVFPHLIDRAKPGVIAVLANGRRFVNEAGSYHDFMQALFGAVGEGAEVTAFLICDRRTLRRYGLGFAKPFPIPLGSYLRSGYLKRGATLAALAAQSGIDPAGLAATVAEYNRDAGEGRDPAFGRGSGPFERFGGDANRQPNPCVAPIDRAPFYAVKVVAGSLGTFAGLKTDRHARVLDGAAPRSPDSTPSVTTWRASWAGTTRAVASLSARR